MTNAAPTGKRIRRAVLVSESTHPVQESLALLRLMAGHLPTELVGLFVEDADLLRAAALPLTREVGMVSGALRALDVSTVELSLRQQAEQLRGQLASLAGELRLPWTFDIARGHFGEQVLRLASVADVVVLTGFLRRRRAKQPGSDTRSRVIAALYEPDAAGARLLATAWQLAEQVIERLDLLVPRAAATSLEALRRDVARQLGVPPARVNLRGYAGAIGDLTAVPRIVDAAALVIPTHALADGREQLEVLLRSLDVSLVLVS